jgi:hypothetical protein
VKSEHWTIGPWGWYALEQQEPGVRIAIEHRDPVIVPRESRPART